MPPKGTKKKDGESSVPTLPTINPLLSAAQTKFDKWVRRVQDITRAKTDAIRDKSGLILTLKEGEAKVRALGVEAEAVAYQPLRPPPPPPPPVPAAVPTPPNGKARKSATSSAKGVPPEPPVEQWKPPDPNEAKRLQKAAEGLMIVYHTKRGGPDKAPDTDKTKKTFFRKKQSPAAATEASPTNNTTSSPSGAAAEASDREGQIHLTTTSQQQQVSPKGSPKGNKQAQGDELVQSSSPPLSMVSLSLAAGAVPISVDPQTMMAEEKPGKTPRGAKKNALVKNNEKYSQHKDPSQAGEEANIYAGPSSSAGTVTLPPIHGGGGGSSSTPVDEKGQGHGTSFRGLEGLLDASPLADGMEKPKHASFDQWNRILQLRQERLALEEANAATREAAMQARDRVSQLKEMEAIGRYGLGAAQRELEQITGTPVPPIPGLTAPLAAPQPPGTPRTVAAAVCPTTSQSAAARPESSSPFRASVAAK